MRVPRAANFVVGMAFVNISLLLGGLLAAIPVVLHLILRPQPKRVPFPALRFLRERRDSNRRQLQLRHWLLLFLRCVALGLLTLALARPSVASASLSRWLLAGLLGSVLSIVGLLAVASAVQRRGKWLVGGLTGCTALLAAALVIQLLGALAGRAPAKLGDQQAPVAAALVFDTSPRMEYLFHNQTRLEQARETGRWLLSQLPPESSVAVLESRPGPPFFAVDVAAAETSIAGLRITGTPDPLADVVARSVDLVRTSDKPRHEVYVFTDMSESAWGKEHAAALRATLDSHPEVLFYVIDVGVDQPRNISLGALELSSQTLVRSGELSIAVDVRSQNGAGEYPVELLIEQPDPSRPVVVDGKPQLPVSQVRDRTTVTLPADGSQRIEFRVRGWSEGTQQGSLRLLAEDGLASDNVRYFAVEVRDAWPVLVVAESDAGAFLLVEAIAPRQLRDTGTAHFDCRQLAPSDLSHHDLSSYAVVCLVDPAPLPPDQWDQLARYVERGGSLAVWLGHNAQPATSFHEPSAMRVLGGKLSRNPWRTGGRDVFLAPRQFDHPALALFRGQQSSVPWDDSPVFRHWVLDERAADSSTVVEFSNGQPAIIERSLGEGRIIVMTTPIAEESRPQGRSAWNELLTSENAWPSFVLLNDLLGYLAAGGESRLNYLAGETATLVNDSSGHPPRYQLFTPLDEPQDLVPRNGLVVVPFTEFAGAYRLKGQRDGPVMRGFAVNLHAAASDLTRVPRDRHEIVLEVGEARVGREFYPFLLLALAVVLGLEHVLANRFYRPATPK
jgi:hypothetical protein